MRQLTPPDVSPGVAGVSIAFVLPAQPTRAAAFRTAFTAVLHTGFGFGRERPGQLVYSYDLQGEHYAAPLQVPAGSILDLQTALAYLAQIAPHFNQSVSLTFTCDQTAVSVTGRVYDDPNVLIVSLDFAESSWQQLVGMNRSLRTATTVLVDAGRTLFTLLSVNYLLIGPTSMLLDLPCMPPPSLFRIMPVVMLPDEAPDDGRLGMRSIQHVEQLPRGRLIVQQWDAGAAVAVRKATPRARARQGKS